MAAGAQSTLNHPPGPEPGYGCLVSLAGLALLVWGAFLLNPALGFAVLGLFLLGVGGRMAKPNGNKGAA
jgi:hypothetical protein